MDLPRDITSIGSARLDRIVQFRVRQGADLLDGIAQAVEQQGIESGVIISGIGALKRAVFRNLKVFPKSYPVQPKDRVYLEIEAPLELLSLAGWIAPTAGGGSEIHAHFSASTVRNDEVITLGGHLTKGTVAGIKVVIAIAVLEPGKVSTALDPVSRTNELVFP
jgi:predicted DNA-binding protein with PD1-like motif